MSGGAADGFTALVSSPLLIGHVRSAGGAGGRRVHAGDAAGAFAVVVEDGRRAAAPRAYGSALAAAQGFNAELDRARRDGLASSPEPSRLSEPALLTALQVGRG